MNLPSPLGFPTHTDVVKPFVACSATFSNEGVFS